MQRFKSLFDIYEWVTKTGSVTDSEPPIFHPSGLFEDDLQELKEVLIGSMVDARKNKFVSWISRYEAEPPQEMSGTYLGWNGKWTTIICHGYYNVWLDATGIPFSFSHWAYIPEGPQNECTR